MFLIQDILQKPNTSNRKKNGIKLVQNVVSQTCHFTNLPMLEGLVKVAAIEDSLLLTQHSIHGQGIGIHTVYKYQVISINRQVFKTLVELAIKYRLFKMTQKGTLKLDPNLFF